MGLVRGSWGWVSSPYPYPYPDPNPAYLNGLDHVHATGDVAEDDVLAVEPVRLDRAPGRVRDRVGG